MKTKTLIILDSSTTDIEAAVNTKLAPYKQEEDPFKPGKWDYWTMFDDDQFSDANRPKNLHSSIEDLILCTNYIDKTKKNFYQVGSVIDLEGNWHDLEDFGWTMLGAINKEEKSSNATKLWNKHLSKIIKESEGLLGIMITTHR